MTRRFLDVLTGGFFFLDIAKVSQKHLFFVLMCHPMRRTGSCDQLISHEYETYEIHMCLYIHTYTVIKVRNITNNKFKHNSCESRWTIYFFWKITLQTGFSVNYVFTPSNGNTCKLHLNLVFILENNTLALTEKKLARRRTGGEFENY